MPIENNKLCASIVAGISIYEKDSLIIGIWNSVQNQFASTRAPDQLPENDEAANKQTTEMMYF